MKHIDTFYEQKPEPIRGCFLAIRDLILHQDPNITNELKYGMPFFCFKKKMFAYLWFHKKLQLPYLGLVEGKLFGETYLIQEDRARMKIFLINPNEDLPLEMINKLITKAIRHAGSDQVNS